MNDGESEALSTALAQLPAHVVLSAAVDALIGEDPTDIAGTAALARLHSLLADTGRLQVAILAAINDMDHRQLFALDAAGSTRGWLRRLPGGDDGQLGRARQLAERECVRTAVVDGSIGPRSAQRVCAALGVVPEDLDEATTLGLITDGIGFYLRLATGGVPVGADPDTEARILAQQAQNAEVLAACATNRLAGPSERVEPALVLLAQRLSPNQLDQALRQLTDALRAEPADTDRSRYFVELRPLLDGDWDLRGVLDPETGHLLAEEIKRHRADTTDRTDTTHTDDDMDDDSSGGGDADVDGALTLDLAHPGPTGTADADPVCDDPDHADGATVRSARTCSGCRADRTIPAGPARHHALRDLLRRGATGPPGRATPTALTVTADLAALTGLLGAPPALLHRPGHEPVPLRPAVVRRLACNSELTAVLLNAAGTPVGASHTARSATPRERRVLRATWGPHCAVHGCADTHTVPHHVVPFHVSRETALRDLVPICDHCHLDVHEGHRTLRLRNGRHISDTGWADPPAGGQHRAAA